MAPHHSDIADVFVRLFVNRADTYAIQLDDGTYTRINAPLSKDVLRRHFTGETTAGAYMINPEDQTTKTLCFDVDPEHVKDPKDVASKILKVCDGRFPRKAVLLEASRYPDLSYHIWVFFEPSLQAKTARFLGRKILEHANVVVELFPKQDTVEPGGFGNLVKLPLGLHRQAGKWSCFLDPATFKPLNPTCLFDVEGCSFSEKDVQRAMVLADRQRGVQAKLGAKHKAVLKDVNDLSVTPCVKAFRDHAIPPGSRHETAAKNLTILYWQAKGTWEGFEAWAEELAKNKPEFTAKNITDWRSWVEKDPRELNCAELGGFINVYVKDFTCEGCPLKHVRITAAEVIPIPHLNMVEDPGLAGKPLTVEAVVASTSVAYLAPKEVAATIQREDGDSTELNETFEAGDPINIKLVGVNEDVKYRRLKRLFGNPSKVKIKEKAWRTIYRLRVRPPVYTLEKRGESIVDERGFEYKAHDVYVAADQPLTFQASTLVKLEAKPLGSPKTQKTVLLATRVEFPEETWLFDKAKLTQLKAKLDSLGSVKKRVGWILSEFEKFSGLVGRRSLAFAGFLSFFAPVWVILDGEIQRGWVVALFMGDTTTGKSETLRKLIMLLKAGMLVTAETASQVGLTGTATQLEKEGWFVDWGFLVLCDRKLLAIDGVHKLPLSCWAALAEAERSGVVTIAKAAKDRAYARTRQIKIANPVDRETQKWTTKPLADFLYPCQALPTVLDKTGIARLDVAVFADSRDVKPEEVNIRMDQQPDADLELLSEALKWCWSGTAKVEFTHDAVKEILTSATELYNTFYTQFIPLVSMDMKWKLARLSAALAHLTLSTDDFTKVKVTAEHAGEVAAFLKDEYGKAGLNTLAQEERYETYTSEDVERIILAISQLAGMERDTLESVFKFIVHHARFTRDQLQTQFGLSDKKQLRPLLSSLQNDKLIRRGNGFYPTPQLIKLYKTLQRTRLPTLPRAEKDPPKKSGSGDDEDDG